MENTRFKRAQELIALGQFTRDELERSGIVDNPDQRDLRVMKTLLSLHCRIDRLQDDLHRAQRPWWQRWFHGECR